MSLLKSERVLEALSIAEHYLSLRISQISCHLETSLLYWKRCQVEEAVINSTGLCDSYPGTNGGLI